MAVPCHVVVMSEWYRGSAMSCCRHVMMSAAARVLCDERHLWYSASAVMYYTHLVAIAWDGGVCDMMEASSDSVWVFELSWGSFQYPIHDACGRRIYRTPPVLHPHGL